MRAMRFDPEQGTITAVEIEGEITIPSRIIEGKITIPNQKIEEYLKGWIDSITDDEAAAILDKHK